MPVSTQAGIQGNQSLRNLPLRPNQSDAVVAALDSCAVCSVQIMKKARKSCLDNGKQPYTAAHVSGNVGLVLEGGQAKPGSHSQVLNARGP